MLCQCLVFSHCFLSNLTAFSISGENSQALMIAISAAVAILLLTLVAYVLIGRCVHSLGFTTYLHQCIACSPQLPLNSEGFGQ